MKDGAQMLFDFDKTRELILKYLNKFDVAASSVLDFTKITDMT